MPNRTAPNQSNRDRYEWDTKLTVDTNMTETPWPNLAQVWLRHPKNFWSRFSILHTWDCDTLKNNDQKILGRLSHICARLGQGVSVILVSMVSLVSHSYHCKLWFKRLTHISLISTPRVSLISVSIGLVWRSHIRHPPIHNKGFTSLFVCHAHEFGH